MKLIVILICSTISTIGLTSADSSAGPSGEANAKQKRTCRIIFPERPSDAPKGAFLFDGKNSQKVQLPSMNFSPVVSLEAGEKTVFMTTNPVTNIKDVPANTPKLNIPVEVNDFYIYVTYDRVNTELVLKMNMISLSDGKFKPSETLWINKTKHRISADLGLTKMTVDPESQTISKGPLEQSGYYRAEFTYQPNAEGDFKKITEQQWWHDEKSRHLGFIISNGDKLPKIYFFRDFR